jgi:hypothetical protein
LAFFPDSALDRSLATVTYWRTLPLSRSRSALIREKIPSPVLLRFNADQFGRLIHVRLNLEKTLLATEFATLMLYRHECT